jgi:hypothetical protein
MKTSYSSLAAHSNRNSDSCDLLFPGVTLAQLKEDALATLPGHSRLRQAGGWSWRYTQRKKLLLPAAHDFKEAFMEESRNCRTSGLKLSAGALALPGIARGNIWTGWAGAPPLCASQAGMGWAVPVSGSQCGTLQAEPVSNFLC